MLLYLVRSVWIGSQICALLAAGSLTGKDSNRVSWWTIYLMFSLFLSVIYFPELIPGWAWYDATWPLTLLVLGSRTIAVLESLHYQTSAPPSFPFWSRLMAGAFLLPAALIISIWVIEPGGVSALIVQYRRYLQIWIGLVALVVQLTLWSVDRVRAWRPTSQHALCLTALAVNHAVVSALMIGLDGRIGEETWKMVNLLSTIIDSMAYLGTVWVWGRIRGVERTISAPTVPTSVPGRIAGSTR